MELVKGKIVKDRATKEIRPARKAGKPKGAINKNTPRELNVAFTSRYVADFKKHGIKTIERVREENPVEYLKIATRLLPKDVNLTIEHTFSDVLFEAHNLIQQRKHMDAIEAEFIEDGQEAVS